MPDAALPLWTSDEIAAAVGGAMSGRAFQARGVEIDGRLIAPGDLFVALSGARDGADFAPQAFAAGAAGALVSRPVEAGPFVLAPDTLQALERLGAAARDRAPAPRCAVTGSVGKTGVTQAIAAALRLAGLSHAPVKSFNNHIGVPLTLARMPRETRYAVFELGMNHAGEIGPLSRLVQPHVAVITTVGPVHTEAFADGEAGVARAKAEIFEGLAPGGVAVLNADDGWFDLLAAAARAHGARVVSFGRDETCDARLIEVERGEREGGVVTADLHGRALRFPIAQSGAHWGPNSLAVLLAVEALGAPLSCGLEALAAFAPLAGRGVERVVLLPGGELVVIDESYNANPVSMRAAIASLGARPTAGRRIAVLTDMLELGGEAARQHALIANALAEAGVDLVFCAGPNMHRLWEALPPAQRGAWAERAEDLARDLVDAVQPGDVVMVKGSNGSKAGLLVQALTTAERTPAAIAAGGARR